jgi:hypothetical protein
VNGEAVAPGAGAGSGPGAGIGAGGDADEGADGPPVDGGVGCVEPGAGAVAGASDGEEITPGDVSGAGIPGATPIVGITPYAPGGAGGA